MFDYLIGNADRMAQNVLVRDSRGRKIPVAIDAGLTFPHGTTAGPSIRPFPTERIADSTGPLLQDTLEMIRGIDHAVVARSLVKNGATDRQIAHVLRRLERMKNDASFLALEDATPAAGNRLLDRVRDAAELREQGLPKERLEALNRVIAEARRQ